MDIRFTEQCYCGDCWRCGFFEDDSDLLDTKPRWSDHFDNDLEAGNETNFITKTEAK